MRPETKTFLTWQVILVSLVLLLPTATALAGRTQVHVDVTKALASAETPRKKKLIDPALKNYAKELERFPYYEFHFAGAGGVDIARGKKANVSLIKGLQLEIEFKSFDKRKKKHTLGFWVYKYVKNPDGKRVKRGIARTTISFTPGSHTFLIVSDSKLLKKEDLVLILSLPKEH